MLKVTDEPGNIFGGTASRPVLANGNLDRIAKVRGGQTKIRVVLGALA